MTGCGEDTEVPTLTGVDNAVTVVGSNFDVMEGVKAFDDKEGEISDRIVYTSNLDTMLTGTYLVSYSVQDSSENKVTAERTIVVTSSEGFVFGNSKDYIHLNNENRSLIISQIEEYFLSNIYGGVPLFEDRYFFGSSSRLDLYSSKSSTNVRLPFIYGSLTVEDTYVQFKNHIDKGDNEFTLRLGMIRDNNHNYLPYYAGNDKGLLSNIYGTLFTYDVEGFSSHIIPAMALSEPQCMNSQIDDCQNNISDTWNIQVRDGLKWSWNDDTDPLFLASITDDDITAVDFVQTFTYLIENNLVEEYMISSSLVDNREFSVTFDRMMSLDQVKRFFTNVQYSPLNFDMLEYAGEDFGESITSTAYSGDYVIDEHTHDYILLTKNTVAIQNIENNYTGIIYYISDTKSGIVNDYLQGYLDYVDFGFTYDVCCGSFITEYISTTSYVLLFNQTIDNPVIDNCNFRKAFYFGVDRKELADYILNKRAILDYIKDNGDTSLGDTITDLTYKNEELAYEYFVSAVNELIIDGVIKKGTSEDYTEIELDILLPQFNHDTPDKWENFYNNLLTDYERLFSDSNNYVKVKFSPTYIEQEEDYRSVVHSLDFESSIVKVETDDALDFFNTMSVFNLDNIYVEITYYREGDLVKELWLFYDILSKLMGGEIK